MSVPEISLGVKIASFLHTLLAPFIPFKHFRERPVIIPASIGNHWSMGSIGVEPVMQVASKWIVTNISKNPMRIVRVYTKYPDSERDMILIDDPLSGISGNYPLRPNRATEVTVHFWIRNPTRKVGEVFTADIIFVDQFNQKRTVKDVKFPSV